MQVGSTNLVWAQNIRLGTITINALELMSSPRMTQLRVKATQRQAWHGQVAVSRSGLEYDKQPDDRRPRDKNHTW